MKTSTRLLLQRLWYAAAGCVCGAAVFASAAASQGQIVAHSLNDFSGTQGANGWSYGYYAADGDGYQDFDFIEFQGGVPGAPGDNAPRFGFNGGWDYFDGAGNAQNPPWTFIGGADIHPDSLNQPLGELWPIRRYTVQPEDLAGTGNLAVLWRTRKTNPNGLGVTGKVFHNGVELGSDAIRFDDRVGVARSAFIPGVQAGDVIDIAYTPVGPTGDVFDGADGGQNLMKVRANATPFVPYQAAPVPLLPNFGIPAYADSVAEFSGTQGQGNWYYGYSNRTGDGDGYQDYDFIEFQEGVPSGADAPRFGFNGSWDFLDAGGGRPNPPWTEIWATGGHPNGTNNATAFNVGENWSIRRWVSEVSGPVTLSGHIDSDGGCDDGTAPTIYVNGAQIFSQHLLPGQGANYSVNVNLNMGDAVDFVIDNGPSGIDFCDGTTFTVRAAQTSVIDVVADSQADFSGTQGARGWRYGYWNRQKDEDVDSNGDGVYAPSEFVEFTPDKFNGSAWDEAPSVAPWTELSAGGGHPAGQGQGTPDVKWAVRRWTSSVDGVIEIEGVLNNGGGGDGVAGRIFVDGYEVWNAWSQGGLNVPYSIFVPVHAGSQIDFAIDSGFLDFDGSDGSAFTAHITRSIPEPSSVVLAGLGVVGALWIRRRRGKRA